VANAAAVLDGSCDNGGRPCFDGFDLDVEYIGQAVEAAGPCQDGGGVVRQIPNFERARTFLELLRALRQRFPLVTIAGPGALYSLKFSWSVMREISQVTDFINVMAYDYTGPWTLRDSAFDTNQPGCAANAHQCWQCAATLPGPITDHHSPLHASPGSPGYYNFLCDPDEAVEGQPVCEAWGGGTLPWDSPAGRAVCVHPYILAADLVIDFYTHGIGVDPSKLVLGVGFYGRAFRGIAPLGGQDAPSQLFGLHQHFGGMCLNEEYCRGETGVPAGHCQTLDGVVPCPGEAPYNWLTDFVFDVELPDPRFVSYGQIAAVCPAVGDLAGVATMRDRAGGQACGDTMWRAYYDEVAEVPWLFHAQEGLLVTFDSPRSVRAKGEWALARGLGGLMFWELAQDAADGALLETLYETMMAE